MSSERRDQPTRDSVLPSQNLSTDLMSGYDDVTRRGVPVRMIVPGLLPRTAVSWSVKEPISNGRLSGVRMSGVS
jgi:hypothetical protein